MENSASRYILQIPEMVLCGLRSLHRLAGDLSVFLLVWLGDAWIALFAFPVLTVWLAVQLVHKRAVKSHTTLAHLLKKENPDSRYLKFAATENDGQIHRCGSRL